MFIIQAYLFYLFIRLVIYLFCLLLNLVANLLDGFGAEEPTQQNAVYTPGPRWENMQLSMEAFLPRFPFLKGPEGKAFLEEVLRPLIGNRRLMARMDHITASKDRYFLALEAVYYWLPRAAYRPLKEWSVVCKQYQGHCYEEYLKQLIRYLFEQHSVPPVVEGLWMYFAEADLPLRQGVSVSKHPAEALQLYFYLTKGGGLRTAPFFNWELGRKAVRFFYEAPANLCIQEAYWYALFRAEGVPAEAMNSQRGYPNGYSNAAFWRDLARLWKDVNPELRGTNLLGVVIHQIQWLKFGIPMEDYLENKRLADKYGAQPEFNFKGRTAASLIRYLEEEVGLQEFSLPQGMQEYYQWAGPDEAKYCMRFIGSAQALIQEGAAMSHCVGDSEYIREAQTGMVSFWSFRLIEAGGRQKRLLTVCLEDTYLGEASGFANREPKEEEYEMLERWLAEQKTLVSAG